MSLDLHGVDVLPTQYFGGITVSQDVSELVNFTAGKICFTCAKGTLEGPNCQYGILCHQEGSPLGGLINTSLGNCELYS